MNKTKKKSKLPLIAGITSAIGAAIAGVVIFKDKNNRDKVKKVLNTTKDQAKAYLKKTKKKLPKAKKK